MLHEGRAVLVVVAAACVLTALMAWSTLGDLDGQLFGRDLVGREHDPFTVMEQYAAHALPRPHLQPATDAPGIALTAAFGPVSAYNLLTLATFPLTAALAFLHARYLVPSSFAAGVAALLFAFAPFHIAHAAYHVHVAQVQWLPLGFLLLWRTLEQPRVGRAASATVALVLVASASAYLGLIALTVAPVAAAAGAFGAPDPRARRLTVALLAWAAAVAALLMLVWSAVPGLLTQPTSLAFPSYALDLHTASAWRYVVAPDGHPFFDAAGESVVGGPGTVEQQLSLGWSVILLAAIGLLAPAARAGRFRRFRLAIALTALFAFLCSLPPVVTLASIELPMPAQALHQMAPVFRAFARFGVVVSLMITVLAGAGASTLLARGTTGARALAIALLAVAVIEYLPPQPLSRDALPTPAHRAMAVAFDARILDCATPSPGAFAGLRLLMAPEVIAASGTLADCAEPAFGSKLAAFGFTHLIVRRDSDRVGFLEAGTAPPGTKRLSGDSIAGLFQVTAARPDLYVVALDGFSPREFRGVDSWRWMGASSSLTVVNVTSRDVTASLELELEPFAGGRTILARTPSGTSEPIRIDRPGWVQLGPLTLPPGETIVTLTADRTVTPVAVGIGADARPLSVRLRGWRFRTQ